jgi:uncharacterized membrane protein
MHSHLFTERPLIIGAMLALACGTFAFRLAGPLLHARIAFPPRARQLLETGANVLLMALVATTALTEGQGFAGYARPTGVFVGGVLIWRKAPLPVIVLAAAGTTAVLRLLHVS